MNDMRSFGARLRSARLSRGWSQRLLAGHSGLSQGFISQLEGGTRALERHADLIALADALSISPAELTGQAAAHDTAVSAAHAAIPALRLALMGAPPIPARIPSNAELAKRVALTTRLYHTCEYTSLVQMLPGLLGELAAGLDGAAGERRKTLQRLLIRVYQPACVLLLKMLGYTDLAWIVIDKAADLASEIEDPIGEAVSGFYRTHVLLAAGAAEAALEKAASAESDISRQLVDPAAFALYGELHLITATTLSTRRPEGRAASDVAAHLAEAVAAARHTGETKANGLNFGPTNIALHGVSTAVELGLYGRAASLAAEIDPFGINAPGRTAGYFGDLARALTHQRGREGEAVAAMLRAESIAPQRVHANVMLAETVGTLAGRRLPQRSAIEVRKLAGRMGLPS